MSPGKRSRYIMFVAIGITVFFFVYISQDRQFTESMLEFFFRDREKKKKGYQSHITFKEAEKNFNSV